MLTFACRTKCILYAFSVKNIVPAFGVVGDLKASGQLKEDWEEECYSNKTQSRIQKLGMT